VLHSVERNEKAHPLAIGFLSTEAIALNPQGSLDSFHQFHRSGSLRGCIYIQILLSRAKRASTRILDMLPKLALLSRESME